MTVLYIDSGIGGIPSFVYALEQLPEMQGVYLADTGYFPYGTKESAQLREHLKELLERVRLQFSFDIVVLACNTASVVALEELRSSCAEPIIGTVPAIKPASQAGSEGAPQGQTGSARIGILASRQTTKDAYLKQLIQKYAPNKEVMRIEAGDLIAKIEENMFEETPDGLREIVHALAQAGIGCLVLGCTHFAHIASSILRLSQGSLRLFDSREGITRQLYRRMYSLSADLIPDLPLNAGAKASIGSVASAVNFRGRARMYISSPQRISYYSRVAEHFSIGFAGVLLGASQVSGSRRRVL